MFGLRDKNRLLIYKDEITMNFLAGLRQRRKSLGLSGPYAAKSMHMCYSNLKYYERGKYCPTLGNLIKLAKFYNVDISDSINWKFYHDEISFAALRRDKEKYALTFSDIVEECGTNNTYLCLTLKGKKQGTLLALGRIIEAVEHEKELEKFRNDLLRKTKKYEKEISNAKG